jgi:hypothetical protein
VSLLVGERRARAPSWGRGRTRSANRAANCSNRWRTSVRSGEAGGLRQFAFHDRSQVVLWGAPGTLTPDLGDSTAVGIGVPQSNGGLAIVVCSAPGSSVPPVGAGTVAGSAARFITNIYRHLGLDLP